MSDAMDDLSVGDNDLYAQIAASIRQQQQHIEELEKKAGEGRKIVGVADLV
jgi:cell division septum initiation protein DivIVA